MSKRKPHNRIKRLITQSKIAVHDMALVMSLNSKLVDSVSWKTGKPIMISQAIASALDRTSFKWFVMLAAHCIESNGKQKLVVQPIQMTAEYRHNELNGYLRATHQTMIDECESKMKVVNASWFALPVPPANLDEDALVKMLLDKPEFWSCQQGEAA